LWLVPGVANNLASATTEKERESLLAAEHYAIRLTVEDFERYEPGLVIVDVGEPKQGFTHAFDFLDFYRSSPEFAQLWEQYAIAGRFGRFELYTRRASELGAS
jgi:hypothetical protein